MHEKGSFWLIGLQFEILGFECWLSQTTGTRSVLITAVKNEAALSDEESACPTHSEKELYSCSQHSIRRKCRKLKCAAHQINVPSSFCDITFSLLTWAIIQNMKDPICMSSKIVRIARLIVRVDEAIFWYTSTSFVYWPCGPEKQIYQLPKPSNRDSLSLFTHRMILREVLKSVAGSKENRHVKLGRFPAVRAYFQLICCAT